MKIASFKIEAPAGVPDGAEFSLEPGRAMFDRIDVVGDGTAKAPTRSPTAHRRSGCVRQSALSSVDKQRHALGSASGLTHAGVVAASDRLKTRRACARPLPHGLGLWVATTVVGGDCCHAIVRLQVQRAGRR